MTQQLLKNRYQLIKTLASGGFGKTYLAQDTDMPSARICVIKQLKPIANDPQIYQLVQDRFQQEAVILEKLGETHGQIPTLYAYFEEDGEFYLVQEWIDGMTLTEKIQQSGPLNEAQVHQLLIQILPVLDYIHSYKIVHRDIKPDNIILRSQDGKPVLIDFGAVKQTLGTVVNTSTNNKNSIVIGTPGFMANEQTIGRPVYASDLYSLGLTAIFALTGKFPQQIESHPDTEILLWQKNVLVSPDFATILNQAIEFHLSDRIESAQAMLQALQSLNKVSTTTLPQDRTLVQKYTPAINHKSPLQVLLPIFLFAGLGFLGYSIANQFQPPTPSVIDNKPTANQPTPVATTVPTANQPTPSVTDKTATANQPTPTITHTPTPTQPTPVATAAANQNDLEKQLDDIADKIFYDRHPDLQGKKLTTADTLLAQEWSQIRRCEAVVDYKFHQKHPKLGGRKILPQETGLAQEWWQIKQTVSGCN